MSKDEFYSNKVNRLDTIVGGDQTQLRRLIQARESFSETADDIGYIQWENFYQWLQDEYGVLMRMTAGGMITMEYDIIDEKKYIIFLMKFDGSI